MQITNLHTILPHLRCPISRESLKVASPTTILSKMFQAPADTAIHELSDVLLNESNSLCYPIYNGIADLRPTSALPIKDTPGLTSLKNYDAGGDIGESVRNWYESFGWQKTEGGSHQDTAYFSMPRSTPYGLYESLSHFAQKSHYSQGTFFLDAASGPIAHSEYVSYSELHDFRVCIDFSMTALKEASGKLGDRAICIQADVLNLPFEDNVFDGAMSGYTVQHIDKTLQEKAIFELYRVLRPGHNLCIMATQSPGGWHSRLMSILAWLTGARFDSQNHLSSNADIEPPAALYGHVFNTDWWLKTTRAISRDSRVITLRFFSREEFQKYSFTKNSVVKLQALESYFSGRLARHSTLVSIIVPK